MKRLKLFYALFTGREKRFFLFAIYFVLMLLSLFNILIDTILIPSLNPFNDLMLVSLFWFIGGILITSAWSEVKWNKEEKPKDD